MSYHLFEDKETRRSLIYRALIFLFAYIAIRYAYPNFFPAYANRYFTVDTEWNRTCVNLFLLVFLWLFLREENKLFETRNRISAAIMICLNYIYFLPGTFMNMFYAGEIYFSILYAVYCIVINCMVIGIGNRKIKPARHLFSRVNSDNICLLLTVLMIALSLVFSGFQINIFNVFNSDEIYTTRGTNELIDRLYFLWYFIIFGATIIPTWLVIALKKKQYIRALLYSVAVFLMFSVNANRQFIFTLAVACAIYFCKKRRNLANWVFMAMWMIPVAELIINKGYILSDVLRRFVLVPNIDAFYHVDFFQENEPDYLRQALNIYANRLGFVSPYSKKIATIIGEQYFGTAMNANTGLLGGNFANYGYLSLVLGPIGYVFSFWILDKVFVQTQHKEILLATAITVAFSVTNYETWIELFITPSWIFFYYIFLALLPTQGIEEPLIQHKGCKLE